MESSGLDGGGVGDLRGGAGDDGRRSPGFGDTGRAYGSGFDMIVELGDAVADTTFIAGGGGIIPLL